MRHRGVFLLTLITVGSLSEGHNFESLKGDYRWPTHASGPVEKYSDATPAKKLAALLAEASPSAFSSAVRPFKHAPRTVPIGVDQTRRHVAPAMFRFDNPWESFGMFFSGLPLNTQVAFIFTPFAISLVVQTFESIEEDKKWAAEQSKRLEEKIARKQAEREQDEGKTKYRMTDPDGDEGEFVGVVNDLGKAEGLGQLRYDDGDIFVGAFKDGVMTEGVLYAKSGVPRDTFKSGAYSSGVEDDFAKKYAL